MSTPRLCLHLLQWPGALVTETDAGSFSHYALYARLYSSIMLGYFAERRPTFKNAGLLFRLPLDFAIRHTAKSQCGERRWGFMHHNN